MSRALIKQHFNPEDTATFLEALQPGSDTHEFCWFAQHSKGWVRQFYGTIDSMIETLLEFNMDGYSIFVCVNAIDVPVYVDNKPKRRKQDVNRVRAVFGDFDDPSKPLPDFALPPSMLIETSPGKHHAYWLTRDMPLDQFETRQHGIIEKYQANGSDRSIRDLSRVMRVPGFARVKDLDNPQPVRLKAHSGTIYSPADLAEAFPSNYSTFTYGHDTNGLDWDGAITDEALFTHMVVRDNWGPGANGRYDVPCPNEAEHTSKTGKNATSYFEPSGFNNGRGGFKCQHAHCAGYGVGLFDKWIRDQVRAARKAKENQ